MPELSHPSPSSPSTSPTPQNQGSLLARLSLQGKVLLATSLSVLLISGLLSLGVFLTFSHSFQKLEEQSARENEERIGHAIRLQLSTLEQSCKDYAWWSESHRFILQPNEGYIQTNLNGTILDNLRLSHFGLFNRQGELVMANTRGKLVKPGDQEAWELETLFRASIRQASKAGMNGSQGLVGDPVCPLLYACMPVYEDEGRGASDGFLIHARPLDARLLDELKALCNLPMSLRLPAPPTDNGPALSGLTWNIEGDQIRIQHPLTDNQGQPVGVLESQLGRPIHQQAQAALRMLGASILVISLFAGTLTLWLMRKLVTSRLAMLQDELRHLGTRTDPSARVEIPGTDEIAALAGDINRMVAAIRNSEERQRKARDESLQLQDQLRQSQKMEVIGTMAGGLAHDFNNTLNSILGSADLLQFELPADHPAQEHIRRIEKAGQGASGIVRQLLAVSRRQPLKQEILSLDSVIRESLDLIRASLPKRIELLYQAETATDNVLGDRTQLQQVLINLATNASHAMVATENPRLLLSLSSATLPDRQHPETAKLPPGSYLRLAVSDNGSGMSEETLAHVFEPFFTTKPSVSGTGLGLAVVHGIITKHNGCIGLDSKLGIGTRFTIHLPLASVAPDIRQAATTKPEGMRPLSILLVDDDRLVLNTLATGLRRSRQEVRALSNSEEALRLLTDPSVPIDVLATDMLMPGMTGLELGIKARELRPGLPMVLISGFTANIEEGSIQKGGFARVIMKPMTPEQLLECIRETVTNRG